MTEGILRINHRTKRSLNKEKCPANLLNGPFKLIPFRKLFFLRIMYLSFMNESLEEIWYFFWRFKIFSAVIWRLISTVFCNFKFSSYPRRKRLINYHYLTFSRHFQDNLNKIEHNCCVLIRIPPHIPVSSLS